MISYKITHDLKEFYKEWEQLFLQNKRGGFFQSPKYVSVWTESFLDEKKQIFMVAVYDKDKLIGLAPCRKQDYRITFLGTDPVGLNRDLVTDFGDIIAVQGMEFEVWKTVIQAAKDHGAKQLVLDFVRESSETFKILGDLNQKITPMDVSPYLILPTGFDEYLLNLDRHQRHEIRRKLRKIETDPSYQTVFLPEKEAVEEFIRLHKLSTKDKDEFMSETMADFFRGLAERFVDDKKMEFVFLQKNSENIAATVSFIAGDEYWLYNSGFDRQKAELPFGLILKMISIKMAIERGFKVYNFLRGAERYKYDLGGRDERMYKVVLKL